MRRNIYDRCFGREDKARGPGCVKALCAEIRPWAVYKRSLDAVCRLKNRIGHLHVHGTATSAFYQ